MSKIKGLITPLRNQVLVRQIEVREKMYGNIHLPDSLESNKLPWQAKVVSIGPKVQHCKPGDIVVASRYGGTPIKYDGTEFTLYQEPDIIAVVRDEPTEDNP